VGILIGFVRVLLRWFDRLFLNKTFASFLCVTLFRGADALTGICDMKKMKFTHLLLVLFVATLSSNTAWSQENRQFQIVGAGAVSCGRYLSLTTNQSQLVELWTQGFLSGMNLYRHFGTQKAVLLPDAPSMKAYMDKFCRENPLSRYDEGAALMFIELTREN
jgi:hypothetical protein